MTFEVKPHKKFYIITTICALLFFCFFFGLGLWMLITTNFNEADADYLVGLGISVGMAFLMALAVLAMGVVELISFLYDRDIYGEEKMCRMQNGKVKFEIFYSNIEYLNKQFGHLIIGCKTPYRQKRKSRVFGEVYHKNDVFKICQAIRNANPSISIRQ